MRLEFFEYPSLQELLKNFYVITIHTTLNPPIHHLINLINLRNIKFIKRGTCLINTTRDKIVETPALVYALKEGILKGSVLDVSEEVEIKEESELLVRPDLKTEQVKTLGYNNVLIKMQNALITPYNAFDNFKKAIKRILKTTIKNIKTFISGDPINIVK